MHLTQIREYALVKSPVFSSFFSSPLASSVGEQHVRDEPQGPESERPNSAFAKESGIACLLESENHVLNATQKQLIAAMLANANDLNLPKKLKFHIYVGREDGRSHVVLCNCCAYEFADLLVKILENFDRFRRNPEPRIARRSCVSSIVKRIIEQISPLEYEQRNAVLPPPRNEVWDATLMFTAGTIHHRSPKVKYRRIVVAASVMLLYVLMPHDYAVRHLGRVIRTADHQSLIELSAIIDTLVLSFPKEVDVWSLKLYLVKEFLKRLKAKGAYLINGVERLLSSDCMGIESFLLKITKKNKMNGRLSWFLRLLHDNVRTLAVRNLPANVKSRVIEQIERYFIKLYSALLVANDGYQGIFYIYYNIVRDHPERLKKLRAICEQADRNESWEANLEILNKAAERQAISAQRSV
ncbi:conserved exonuclease [Babesia ovata]|uniref:Conserved exonuclease n=1 Tax=Babesia ovata TaxID=189622 RepID=A0A2H6KEC6_9APIC|nr:conserved exonuclease [Babesia ovata]GBE61351.1 conserved exonuclease [Babesia ovata]